MSHWSSGAGAAPHFAPPAQCATMSGSLLTHTLEGTTVALLSVTY
jgi:hypothetical protein